MPKLKTNKGVRKRFKVTKNGKIKKQMAGKGHILTKKSKNRKRKLRQSTVLASAMVPKFKKLLPYGY